MKLSKKHLGKLVEIQWRDPKLDHAEGAIPTGWDSLAYQRDWGILASIQGKVATIIHCASCVAKPEISWDINYHQLTYTVIPECLIEKITVFMPVKKKA